MSGSAEQNSSSEKENWVLTPDATMAGEPIDNSNSNGNAKADDRANTNASANDSIKSVDVAAQGETGSEQCSAPQSNKASGSNETNETNVTNVTHASTCGSPLGLSPGAAGRPGFSAAVERLHALGVDEILTGNVAGGVKPLGVSFPAFSLHSGLYGSEALNNSIMATPPMAKLALPFPSPKEMVEFLRTNQRVTLVDIACTDLAGRWHHCTLSAKMVTEKSVNEGFAFDASSIPMFEKIDNSDLVMRPEPETCFLDPFAAYPTLHVTASIYEPNGRAYDKCPRALCQRAIDFMKSSGVADTAYFGPEMEFFLFNSVRFSAEPHRMLCSVDGDEAYWREKEVFHGGNGGAGVPCGPAYSGANSVGLGGIGGIGGLNGGGMMNGGSSGAGVNRGHRANIKEGYMTSRPVDKSADVRSEMLLTLEQIGISTEKHHHEVATCQMEINIRTRPIMEIADGVQALKYVIKNVAEQKGMTATFMPKPLSNDNGSGMHCNQSLWKDGKNLFFDADGEFCQMSKLACHYTAGILHHCKALLALSCPTTNSYRRLIPDFEAPVHICYSVGNRSAAVRIPTYTSEKTKRIEFRSPDASCCPYVAFSAQLLAGLDGILRELPLPPAASGNLFDSKNALASTIDKCPTSLEAALNELDKDRDFLTSSGVFSDKLIDNFIAHKRSQIRKVNGTPHPLEYMLYYGC